MKPKQTAGAGDLDLKEQLPVHSLVQKSFSTLQFAVCTYTYSAFAAPLWEALQHSLAKRDIKSLVVTPLSTPP